MNFDYSEEQQLLADSVNRFIAKDYDFEARKKIVASKEGYSAEVWSTLAQMGLLGIPFDAELGGFGGGAPQGPFASGLGNAALRSALTAP